MIESQQELINHSSQDIYELIRQYLVIQDFMLGSNKEYWQFRFRGTLRNPDSEFVYDQLSDKLKKYHLTPLLKLEKNLHVFYLTEKKPEPKTSNPKINLLLFILTLISVWITGGIMAVGNQQFVTNSEKVKALLIDGWPFAVSILAILGAHEMGHYIAGRIHGVHVTLPYFIPLPIISPFGTMGAFINMKSVPKNHKQLFDIGIAGPISGLIVAIPVLIIGLLLSKIETLPSAVVQGAGLQMEGNSLIYILFKYIIFGKFLPEPASFNGMSPFLYWVKYFFTGKPFPFGGLDVIIHPVAWAGWAGLLVTSLNLLPVGQLDGGHILVSVFGEKVKKIFPFILIILVGLGFAWSGWWFWAALLFMINRLPSQVYDSVTPLDKKRKIIAVLMLIIFVLVFIPVPIVLIY
jgi:membrane-associated protease RseP (regulator of RpoE activity)